jgi:hypothetical protein
LLGDLGKQLICEIGWVGLQLHIADDYEASHYRREKTSLTSALVVSKALDEFIEKV